MKTALWIIAICEAIRTVQNTVQLWWIHGQEKRNYEQHEQYLNKGFEAFVKSLKEDGKEEQKEGNDGWISCEDRVPQVFTPCIVTVRNEGLDGSICWPTIEYANYNPGIGFVNVLDKGDERKVVAWKPAPEHYKDYAKEAIYGEIYQGE